MSANDNTETQARHIAHVHVQVALQNAIYAHKVLDEAGVPELRYLQEALSSLLQAKSIILRPDFQEE